MKAVKSYAEWKEAAQAVGGQLRAVEPYLNGAGMERKAVMETLLEFASFCETAAELLEWIESRQGMNRYENKRLSSPHAESPILRLRVIAAADKKQGG